MYLISTQQTCRIFLYLIFDSYLNYWPTDNNRQKLEPEIRYSSCPSLNLTKRSCFEVITPPGWRTWTFRVEALEVTCFFWRALPTITQDLIICTMLPQRQPLSPTATDSLLISTNNKYFTFLSRNLDCISISSSQLSGFMSKYGSWCIEENIYSICW